MPPRVPEGRDRLERAATELAALFAGAELALTERFARMVARGLRQHPDDVLRAVQLRLLRDDAERIAERLRKGTPGEVDRVMAVALLEGHYSALRELGPPSSPLRTRAVQRGRALGGTRAAVAVAAELAGAVDNAARRILRWPGDVYARASAQAATDLVTGAAANSRAAQARAWQALTSQGVTGPVDARGRAWSLASYVETATRTATRRAWDVEHEATYADAGVELVSIVVGSGACKACTDWSGRILRVNAGPTGRLTLPNARGAGDVTVTVDGTLDDARSAGWRHVNCRCRPVAYLPGLSVVTDVTTYDPQAEADRARLRALERYVRGKRMDAAAAVTPDARRVAEAAVRAGQARIRDHVAATGLVRQRNREQVDLGHRR